GKITGASRAASASSPTIPTPIQRTTAPQRRSDRARRSSACRRWAFSFWRRGRAGAAEVTSDPDPRVDESVRQDGEQGRQDPEHAEDERQRGDGREVAHLDRRNEQRAEPRNREDVLDHHAAADQVADVDGEDRDRGDERIAERVLADDARLP